MKRIVCTMLVAAALAALGGTTTQAEPPTGVDRNGVPKSTVADDPARVDRPRAPEVWIITVKERTRRSTQFPWGPWHVVKICKGTYEDAMWEANDAADAIDRKGKNHESSIDKKRIR
jgi:hypothetical protein